MLAPMVGMLQKRIGYKPEVLEAELEAALKYQEALDVVNAAKSYAEPRTLPIPGSKPEGIESEAALKYQADHFNDGLLYLSNWPDTETPPDTMVLVTGSWDRNKWDRNKGKYSISYDAYLPEEESINIIKEEFLQAYEKARFQDRVKGLSRDFSELVWAEMEADWNGEPEEE
jgi:DNA primase large subunit